MNPITAISGYAAAMLRPTQSTLPTEEAKPGDYFKAILSNVASRSGKQSKPKSQLPWAVQVARQIQRDAALLRRNFPNSVRLNGKTLVKSILFFKDGQYLAR